ncbi:SusD/RagB family nutrient-binding outer membrane lipoprotein [Polaribacter sp. MSW13]|uniref:SusD/RagB family nutrient-binding outer membrane lipoprotein n=1 Tax=Polaribacter marinus TaxID=2916838 RepID=A0A9X1VPA0_9FLAO|nr:SusD/RagB family nutrient-binding outer membrane lipoprotein [Polaribacter marinus]MCI2229836.1 SusD/RagB family nutrient-binding outer membrane lipoprotein [Polaribacter marinus]
MKKRIYIMALFVFLMTLTQSCDDFKDLNVDPTTSTTANPKTLISKVQTSYSGDRETQWRSLAAYHMSITQMISDGWTVSHGQAYKLDISYMEYMWKSSYREINDLILAIQEAEKTPELVNYVAVARILKVMIFAQLTDSYGNIPYFEAGAQADSDNLHPAYDKQEDIYNDFFKELKEASAQLNSSMPLEGDLIYSGNVDKWRKFANSLRLRYAMRLVNVNESKAQSEALLAISAGVMSSVDDAATVIHGNFNVSTSGANEIRGNGFSQVQNFSEEIIVACETYVSYLRDNNDPRLSMMFGMYAAYQEDATSRYNSKSSTDTSLEITDEYLAKYGAIEGYAPGYFLWEAPQGAPSDIWSPRFVEKNGKIVQIDKYFKSLQIRRNLTRIDLPSIYQSYSEVELWLAEVAQRGWSNFGGDAKTHYKNAIFANVDELVQVLGAEPNLNLNTDVYAENLWNNTPNKMEAINMQHYVNNFFNGIEGFANWRRSGFPKLKPTTNNAYTDQSLNGLIPRKLPYPNTEMNFNRDNLEPNLDNGVNFWGAPVWWDNSLTRGVDL